VLVPVWTGQPADTRTLVAATCALADRDPEAYRAHLAGVAAAAAALAAACREGRADRAVEAVAAGGDAVRDLGRAARVDLYVDTHRVLAERAAAWGGALKPTGAGGGDVALAAFDRAEGAEEFRADVVRRGMEALDLRVDPEGALVESDSA
jgi:phosphomevalonate kinase